MKNFKKESFFLAVSLLLLCNILFFGCDKSQLYEKNIDVKDATWSSSQPVSFDVTIDDVHQQYRFYLNVRHTNWFPYQNLWVIFTTKYPDNTTTSEKINIKLSNSDESDWLGDGLGDIWDLRAEIKPKIKAQKGKYVFTVSQIMREDPLPGIMAMGLRVEKVN